MHAIQRTLLTLALACALAACARQEAPPPPQPLPTARPAPTEAPVPESTTPVALVVGPPVNPCALLEVSRVAEWLGPMQDEEVAGAGPAGAPSTPQSCSFAAERGALALALYPGDDQAAARVADSIAQAGAPLTMTREPGGEIHGEGQERAVVVRRFGDQVLAVELRFGMRATQADRQGAHALLGEVVAVAFTRYAAGLAAPRPTAPPAPTVGPYASPTVGPDVTVIVN